MLSNIKNIKSFFNKSKENRIRILIEDALKYFFNCQQENKTCSIEEMKEHLSLSNREVNELISRLKYLNLIEEKNSNLVLTDEGNKYAIRIIRFHRLLEQYSAEKIGHSKSEWHSYAEKKEHSISIKDADDIAKELGNPIFDPHGDPIPTIEGNMPSKRGRTLIKLQKDDIGKIIHIEDEPKEIYLQLINLNLNLGTILKILSVNFDEVIAEINNKEVSIPIEVAKNITVEKLSIDKPEEKIYTLSSLKIGEEAEIVEISNTCRGMQRRRLMDLGIIPGTKIIAMMKSPFGYPIAYKVRNTLIALRKNQTDLIFIKKIFDNKN